LDRFNPERIVAPPVANKAARATLEAGATG
jgi:hypothetical protein